MEDEVTTYILPAYWASALINEDYSGLEDTEGKELKSFLESIPNLYCVNCSEESFFSWSPDAGLPGDCLEYSFLEK